MRGDKARITSGAACHVAAILAWGTLRHFPLEGKLLYLLFPTAEKEAHSSIGPFAFWRLHITPFEHATPMHLPPSCQAAGVWGLKEGKP